MKKDEEEKEVKKEVVDEKAPSEAEVKKQGKLFRDIVIVMAACALMFFITFMLINASKTFEYKGVKFYVDKTSAVGITLYNTKLPVIYNGTPATYNIYLRTDPRSLNDVPFKGTLLMESEMVINSTAFNCNGDDIIAVANIVKLYNNVLDIKVIKNQSIGCDPAGRYMYLNILEGNQTRIVQTGLRCYNIYVNNCEVLKGTERFMVETLSRANSVLK